MALVNMTGGEGGPHHLVAVVRSALEETGEGLHEVAALVRWTGEEQRAALNGSRGSMIEQVGHMVVDQGCLSYGAASATLRANAPLTRGHTLVTLRWRMPANRWS
eukprot:102817-Chlamydomonas_euryale.AAC.1